MDLVEKLIKEFKVKKNDAKPDDSRSRLKAVGEETVKRKVGVQHIDSARLAKSKFTRPCSSCCCLSHCEKNPHRDEHDVQVELSSLDLPDDGDAEYRDMLDRSWISEMPDYEAELSEAEHNDEDKLLNDYETELLESVPLIQDTFMSSLCSINMDLTEAVVEDQLASADNLMV